MATIFASGIDRLTTQVFFADEALNDSDPVLQSLDPSIRSRLIATPRAARAADGAREYELEIVLRGGRETPFFDDWEPDPRR